MMSTSMQRLRVVPKGINNHHVIQQLLLMAHEGLVSRCSSTGEHQSKKPNRSSKSGHKGSWSSSDAILPRKGPITRTMSKRLQEDWARAAEEGPRVLMNLRVDF